MRSGNVAHRLLSLQCSLSVARGGRVHSYSRTACRTLVDDVMNSRNYRESLIDEVKKYPMLYDTRSEGHRDNDARDRCWFEISERLGANSEVLRREWKILRDSMRQAMKRSNTGPITKNGLPCKKWRFQNKMAFLLPYMTVRQGRQYKDMKDEQEAVEVEENRPEAELWDPDSSPAPDNSSLELFFASVCQSTKRLPSRLQASVKRQVLDVLLRVEEEWDQSHPDTKLDLHKEFD